MSRCAGAQVRKGRLRCWLAGIAGIGIAGITVAATVLAIWLDGLLAGWMAVNKDKDKGYCECECEGECE